MTCVRPFSKNIERPSLTIVTEFMRGFPAWLSCIAFEPAFLHGFSWARLIPVGRRGNAHPPA